MDDTKKYKCSGCNEELRKSAFHEFKSSDRKRPVTSRCKVCRKEDYYKKTYSTVCNSCMKHRPVDESNNVCKPCNEQMGLRQCKECKELLPLFLSFYGRSMVCKACRKKD